MALPGAGQDVEDVRLTIDSEEPLERVLAVVGSLFQVELGVLGNSAGSGDASGDAAATTGAPATDGAGPDETPAASTATGGAPARSSRRRRPGRQRATAAAAPASSADSTPDTATVRAWARENGITVSPRGRLSSTVLASYRDAQS